jgi:hypothetical protein
MTAEEAREMALKKRHAKQEAAYSNVSKLVRRRIKETADVGGLYVYVKTPITQDDVDVLERLQQELDLEGYVTRIRARKGEDYENTWDIEAEWSPQIYFVPAGAPLDPSRPFVQSDPSKPFVRFYKCEDTDVRWEILLPFAAVAAIVVSLFWFSGCGTPRKKCRDISNPTVSIEECDGTLYFKEPT